MKLDVKPLYLLWAAITLQFCILAGEYINAVYPLVIGKEAKFYIEPVDPRSLMRGHYARLDYEIRRIHPNMVEFGENKQIPSNSVIYGILEQDGEVYKVTKFVSTRPKSGFFIRGRLRWAITPDSSWGTVDYGIEAYFTKKEISQDIEKRIREVTIGGVRKKMVMAIVKIAPNGKAALDDLFFPLD